MYMPHEIVKLPSIKSNLSELSRENVLRIQLTCVNKSIWLVKNDHEIQAYASTSTHTFHKRKCKRECRVFIQSMHSLEL